jgi:hypothetical protein
VTLRSSISVSQVAQAYLPTLAYLRNFMAAEFTTKSDLAALVLRFILTIQCSAPVLVFPGKMFGPGSTASNAALAHELGIHARTVARWKARRDVADRSTRPHRLAPPSANGEKA